MKNPLPQTDSIDELARFWESHDLSDFADELVEVESPFHRGDDKAVPVPLSAKERREVRKIAGSRGVREATLIREWVREKLHRP